MTETNEPLTIDARNMHYTPLNMMIREAVSRGVREITIDHVLGQRFIADGLKGDVTITINGIPGGDLGMFMSGPTCIVNGNCDHAPGNTMDGGTIVIHGSGGDAVAHSMRGGHIFVRDSIGYRGAIHMKEYQEKRPCLVVGGTARAFFGEYMAGGIAVLLNLKEEKSSVGRGIGSGIHGGEIFVRGDVEEELLGVGAKLLPCTDEAKKRISPLLKAFAGYFNEDFEKLLSADYVRIEPSSARPFAGKYTWE